MRTPKSSRRNPPATVRASAAHGSRVAAESYQTCVRIWHRRLFLLAKYYFLSLATRPLEMSPCRWQSTAVCCPIYRIRTKEVQNVGNTGGCDERPGTDRTKQNMDTTASALCGAVRLNDQKRKQKATHVQCKPPPFPIAAGHHAFALALF